MDITTFTLQITSVAFFAWGGMLSLQCALGTGALPDCWTRCGEQTT